MNFNRTLLMTAGMLGATLAGGDSAHAQHNFAPAPAQYFPMPSTGGAPLPFSEAVRVADTLYVSGQIGNAPGTLTLVPGGIGPEARRTLDNIQSILERHDSSMQQIVKCTVFLADMKDWPAFNEVYREYFKTHFPARSALGVNGLAFNARVEVECIALTTREAGA